MKRTYKPIIVAISLFFAFSASISAAPGDLDPSFGDGGRIASPDGSQNTRGPPESPCSPIKG